MHFTIAHPEIQSALKDLRRLLAGHTANVESVELFGSTLRIPVEDAQDIDFFVAFRGVPFAELRAKLLAIDCGRHLVVESLEASYSNCPSWEVRTPLTLHLILYRKGISAFSEKLTRTRKAAVDVTTSVVR